MVDRPNWQRWSSDPAMWEDPATWNGDFFTSRDRTLSVFATLADLLEAIPDDLRGSAITAIEGSPLRELDI